MKKIRSVLTKAQIKRLRDILELEVRKEENGRYYAILIMFIQDLEDISFHEHYLSLLYFMKWYRTKIDMTIKRRLRKSYDERSIDIQKKLKQYQKKFHKYTQKEWRDFLRQSQYFFKKVRRSSPLKIRRTSPDFAMFWIYLGLGFEFLLKAIYLKKGYLLNEIDYDKLNRANIPHPAHPVRLSTITKQYLRPKTFNFGHFIKYLYPIKTRIADERNFEYYIKFGLLLVQIYRNEDIHTPRGAFQIDNLVYGSIKSSYDWLYKFYLPDERKPKSI